MSNEINFSSVTGLTITAQLYLAGLAEGSPFAVAEIGTTGEYQANMPAVAAGTYLVIILSSGVKVGSGWIEWDGAREIDDILDNVSGELAAMPDVTAATLEEKITWLFEYFAHQRSVTATGETLFKADGVASLGTSVITKDATTYTKGKME